MTDAAAHGTFERDIGEGAKLNTRYHWWHRWGRAVMASAKEVPAQLTLSTILQMIVLGLIGWIGVTLQTAHDDHRDFATMQTTLTELKTSVQTFNATMSGTLTTMQQHQIVQDQHQAEQDQRLDCLQGVVPSNECRRTRQPR